MLRIHREADQNLAARKAGTDQHVADHSSPALLVVGLDPMSQHPLKDRVKNRAVIFCADETLVCRRPVFHSVPAVRKKRDHAVAVERVKSRRQIPVLIAADRVNRLIAVMKRLLHPDNRKKPVRSGSVFREASDPDQIIPDHGLLPEKLRRVIHVLQLTPSAGTGRRAGRLHPVRRWLDHAEQARVSVSFFRLRNFYLGEIADDRVADEERVSVRFSDALTGGTDVRHAEEHCFVFLKLFFTHIRFVSIRKIACFSDVRLKHAIVSEPLVGGF